jgi:hypothetical protein
LIVAGCTISPVVDKVINQAEWEVRWKKWMPLTRFQFSMLWIPQVGRDLCYIARNNNIR